MPVLPSTTDGVTRGVQRDSVESELWNRLRNIFRPSRVFNKVEDAHGIEWLAMGIIIINIGTTKLLHPVTRNVTRNGVKVSPVVIMLPVERREQHTRLWGLDEPPSKYSYMTVATNVCVMSSHPLVNYAVTMTLKIIYL